MREGCRIFVLAGCVFFVLICLGTTAMAQEKVVEEMTIDELFSMSLDDLMNATTTTATRRETTTNKAPATMTLITEAEIKRSGARDLKELLDKVPGYTNWRYFMTNWHGSSFRGIASNSSKIKLLLNGHEVATPYWKVHYYNTPLENVKQVEMIRGPGSALYGTNAFAAVVNVITKTPAEIDGTAVDVKYGSFETTQADLTYGKVFGDWEVALNLNYDNADDNFGEKYERDLLVGTNLSLAPGDSGYRERENYTASANLKFKDLSLSGLYFDGQWTDGAPPAGALTETKSYSNEEYYFVEAKYDWRVSDRLKIKPKVSYDYCDFDWKSQYFPNFFMLANDPENGIPIDLNGDGEPDIFPIDTWSVDTDGDGLFDSGDGVPELWTEGVRGYMPYEAQEVKTELLFDYDVSDTNTLLVGLFYEYTDIMDSSLTSEMDIHRNHSRVPLTTWHGAAGWHDPNDRDVWGAFFQDEWDFTDAWTLVLSGRYDDYDDVGSTFNPRGALVYSFDEANAGVVKFIYSTAFRAPTMVELHNTHTNFLGNEDLDPEELETYEVNVGYVLAKKLRTSVSVYKQDVDNLVVVAPAEAPDPSLALPWSQFVNAGEINIWGVETEMRYEFARNNYLYAAYCYTDATDDDHDDMDAAYVPKDQVTCGLNLHFWDFVNWNINLDYTDERPREFGDPRDPLPSETVWDTTLRLENCKGFDVYFSIHNIFDEDRSSPTPLQNYPLDDTPEAGTDYTVGVTYRF